MTQLDELRAEMLLECAAAGHKMSLRAGGGSWKVERCVVCGTVESVVYHGGPLVRLGAWLSRQEAQRQPWTCEPGYGGPLEPDLAIRLAEVPESVTPLRLYLLPLTWRTQNDGRVAELGKLGGDVFRVIWRNHHTRSAALIGDWPKHKRRVVATVRLRPQDPVEVGDHLVHGDIVVVDVVVA